MARYFFDSSGIVKRYISETGTAWIQSLCLPSRGNVVYAAHVTGAQAVAAIMRRMRRGEISSTDAAAAIASLQSHLRQGYSPVFITEGLVQRAMSLVQAHRLRGYDAIHLAAALEIAAELAALGFPSPIFVAADNDLNAAATAEGLVVDNPNAHP